MSALEIGSRSVITARNHTVLADVCGLCGIKNLKTFRRTLGKISLSPYPEASLLEEVGSLQQLPACATSAQIDRYRPSDLLNEGGCEIFLSD